MPSDDVVHLLRHLVRCDTTNFGAGEARGETACAEWIAERLRGSGYEPVLLHRGQDAHRANLVVEVEGSDPGLPRLVVHGHLDVVPAEGEWSVEPFAAEVADGYVWGRGTTDMKDMCANMLAVLLTWAREDVRPRRGMVFAFVADEEDRGDWGAEWLVAEHPGLFDGCGAAIGEDGAICAPTRTPDGRTVRLYPIACAERGTLHARLTASGVGGHGSRPTGDDALARLIAALGRIAAHRWPLRLSDVVREQLATTAAALGVTADLESEAGVTALLRALGDAAGALPWTIRASATPTVVRAGTKVNVVPTTATAELDVRCPPGTLDDVKATLTELVGDDVSLEFIAHQPPVASPVDSPWFAAMAEAVRTADPDAAVVPACMGGGTDAKAFAKLGLLTYGFTPIGPDAGGRVPVGMHGVDERVPIEGLRWGHRVLRSFLESV